MHELMQDHFFIVATPVAGLRVLPTQIKNLFPAASHANHAVALVHATLSPNANVVLVPCRFKMKSVFGEQYRIKH